MSDSTRPAAAARRLAIPFAWATPSHPAPPTLARPASIRRGLGKRWRLHAAAGDCDHLSALTQQRVRENLLGLNVRWGWVNGAQTFRILERPPAAKLKPLGHRLMAYILAFGRPAGLPLALGLCKAPERPNTPPPSPTTPDALVLLRAAISGWSAKDRAETLARRRQHAGPLSAAQRLVLGVLFPEDPTCRAELAALRLDEAAWPLANHTAAEAMSACDLPLDRLGACLDAIALDRPPVAGLCTAIARLGAEAAPLLDHAVARWGALACLPAAVALRPEVAVAAVAEARGASQRQAFATAVGMDPQSMIPGLLTALDSRGRKALDAWLGKALDRDDALRAALPALPGAARRHCEGLLAGDAAPTVGDVPEVLRTAPHRRPVPDHPPLPFTARDWPAELRWAEGERDAWLATAVAVPAVPPAHAVQQAIQALGLPPEVARLAAGDEPQALAALKRSRGRGWFPLPRFAHLPRQFAVQLWNTQPPITLVGMGEGLPWWLATAGLEALPGLLRLVRENPESLGAALPFAALSIAPVALAYLDAGGERSAPARAWVARHPDVAARWLLAQAAQGDDKAQTLARARLRRMGDAGLGEAVLRAAGAWGPAGEAAAQRLLTGWPRVTPVKRRKLPAWWRPPIAPAPTTRAGTPLPPEAVDHLAALMQASTVDAPHGWLAQALEALDRDRLARFAQTLLDRWIDGGMASSHRWALEIGAHLGDDAYAAHLAARSAGWIRGSKWGEVAVDVLRAIGTRSALRALGRIVDRWATWAIGRRAAEALGAIARRRGLTAAQLADRILPDAGLPPRGQQVLDFGPRQFTLRLTPALELQVVDAAGAVRKGLPRKAKADIPERVTAARSQLSDVKTVLQTARPAVITHLERALAAGGRWAPADFRAFVLDHPLLARVAPSLVWGRYNDGALLAAGLLDGAGTLRALDGAPVQAPDEAGWGLVHPVDLSAADRAAFAQALGDRPPPILPQLDRPIHALWAEERAAHTTARFAGRAVSLRRLDVAVRARRWRRGAASEDRSETVVRGLPVGLAVLQLSPGLPFRIDPRDFEHFDPQEVSLSLWRGGQRLTFGDLPPRAVSELFLAVEQLMAAHQAPAPGP